MSRRTIILLVMTMLATLGVSAASAPAHANATCNITLVSSPVTIKIGYQVASPQGVVVCIDSAPTAPGAAAQSVRVDAVLSTTWLGQSSAGAGTADYFVGYNTQPSYTISPSTTGDSVLTVAVPFQLQVNGFTYAVPGGDYGVIVGTIPLGRCNPGELCTAAGTPKISVVSDGSVVPLLDTGGPTGVGLVPSEVFGVVGVGTLGGPCVLGLCLLPSHVETNPGGGSAGTLYVAGRPVALPQIPELCVYSATPGGCP